MLTADPEDRPKIQDILDRDLVKNCTTDAEFIEPHQD